MDGVTILSEMSVRGEGLFFVIAWILLSITFIVGAILDNIDNWRYFGLSSRIMSIIFTILLGAFMSVVSVCLCCEYNTFYTEYKIKIDDSVGFNEFNEHYKIVSQDGDIYTVREKELVNEAN